MSRRPAARRYYELRVLVGQGKSGGGALDRILRNNPLPRLRTGNLPDAFHNRPPFRREKRVRRPGTFFAEHAYMKTKKKKWSAQVTKKSDAMDLKKNVFKQASPKKIARSVLSSAAHSQRRKAPPKRSAMSMLSFYANRAGKNLSPAQRKKIEKAKTELRKMA